MSVTESDDTAALTDIFKAGPMRKWPVEDIAKDKIMRFAQAYLLMAGAGYRPAAPSDGLGTITRSREQFEDRERLYTAAATFLNLATENASDYPGNPMGTNARTSQSPGWFGPGPNETFPRYDIHPSTIRSTDPGAYVAQLMQNWARALQPTGYVDPLTRAQRWQSIVNNRMGDANV